MTETTFDLIQRVIDAFLRAPDIREVVVWDLAAEIAASSGALGDSEIDLLRAMAAGMLPATKRMVEISGNINEAQAMSFPEDNLHLLVFWLTDEYFGVIFYSRPQNPYEPPGTALKACDLIRTILQSHAQQREEVQASVLADLEVEIGLERLVSSNQKELSTKPNLYDQSFVEAQQKQVVTIAREVLIGKIGIIEGARLLAKLRPTVTRDDFDPDFLPFVVIDSETGTLPIGKERELWASCALLEKDSEIRSAGEFYREQAVAACRVILERFAGKD
jgi:hypothetical protein